MSTGVVAERKARSHSQLASYLQCSHSYYLRKIKRVTEGPSVWSAGGKAFHSAGEALNRASWEAKRDGAPLDHLHDPAPFVEIFHDEFNRNLAELRENDPDESTWKTAGKPTKAKPHGEDVAWWREAGAEFTTNYVAWRASVEDTLVVATINDGPAVELEVTVPMGGVPMLGYVDLVLVDTSTGQWFIVDLKTGSRTPISPLQLALYSVQLEIVAQHPITWGCYYDARKGGLTQPVDLSRFTAAKLGRIYDTFDRGVQEGIFLPNIDSLCNTCGVRRACVYMGGIEPA